VRLTEKNKSIIKIKGYFERQEICELLIRANLEFLP
jgi:hypothetical protein